MSLSGPQQAELRVPEGYVVVPLSPQQATASLRLNVLVRRQPDPVAGHLVVLRDTVDGRVLLGAVTDAMDRVHDWVEVWIQTLDGLTMVVPAYVEALSNHVLDERWRQQFESFRELEPSTALATGWESIHPGPVLLNLDSLQSIHPVDRESGHPWQLCLDDALLTEKELPPYSTSLHRYLYLQPLGGDSPFLPVTTEAPSNGACVPTSRLTDELDGTIAPLNTGGGLIMVRRFCPIGFEPFLDFLGGGSWPGVAHGRSVLKIGTPSPGAPSDEGQGQLADRWLLMGASGRWARLIETLHLKLRILADAIGAVSEFTRKTQRPHFDLSPDSFQVSLGHQGPALPFLWTAKPLLADSGVAIAMPIQTTDASYYLPGRATGTSIYRPQWVDQIVRGKAALRIRQLLTSDTATTTLEGTMSTQQAITPSRYDLVWLRLNLASGRVDLYAHLDREAAMAKGEWRFRTIVQKFQPQQAEALRAAEGVPLNETPFEVVPLLSSPCDLYALGVIAVRTLLVDTPTKLSVALDAVMSLAQQVSVQEDGPSDLAARIKTVFKNDQRWLESLGPHHLTQEDLQPQQAFDVVPPQLWWAILAMLVKMFPGVGPDCPCHDFGDAPPGGIHKIYDGVLRDLDALLLRTRSLIVIDWRLNREVNAVLRKIMLDLGVE